MAELEKSVQILMRKGDRGTIDFEKIAHKPTTLSRFENDCGFITSAIENFTNYYLKTEIYTQNEINNINCLANYYLKTDTYTQNEIDNINSLNNYHTKSNTYSQGEIDNILSLANYYSKTETYTQEEVDNAISAAIEILIR